MKLFFQKNKMKGFTLIELTVAITVLSIIFATSLSLLSARMELTKINATESRMAAIASAIQQFILNGGGYLPCPADATLDFDNANYGVEMRGVSCNGNITVFDSVRGAVPADVLGLSREEFMTDGWGNKFTYVIDNNIAFNAANFINVAQGGLTVNLKTREGAVTTVNNAVYIIISHGKNGHGAWSRYGGARIDKGVGNVDEVENAGCGNGVTSCNFAENEVYVKSYPDFFSTFDFDSTDDIVYFRTKIDILSKR